MKLFKTLSINVTLFCLVATAAATELNGRINILNNDGTNYKIMLQVNTDLEPDELGGATIVLNFDNTVLSYPDEPEINVDFIFYNFNLGYYDEAKVTKVTDNQIWLNVDLISDENGSLVTGGPYQWTDLVSLNFGSNRIIASNAVFWDIYSSYWGVYSSDNTTSWGIGNFDNLTSSTQNEIIDNQPYSFVLNQNYPNPFNPSTKISWYSPVSEWQTLKVYDLLGNEIATLVDEFLPAGNYEIEFSTLNGSTNNLVSGVSVEGGYASGVYFYRLQIGSFVQSRKMVLMK